MRFLKFNEFLKDRDVSESNNTLNRTALDYDKILAQFNARFDDPKQAEDIVRSAGYSSVTAFVNDPNPKKWSRLRVPGQENYVN